MANAKTVRMKFKEDKFYNDLTKPYYLKDVIYNVPEEMRDRWVKRGGELVDEDPAPVQEELDQPKVENVETDEDILGGDEEALEDDEESGDDSLSKKTKHGNKKTWNKKKS